MSKNKIAITSNVKEFQESLTTRIESSAIPDQNKLFAIGNLVKNQAVDNITASGAVDTGELRSKIQFIIEEGAGISRVVVGAFGVKYARMVEFGGPFTDQMRKAMFATFRDRGKTPKPGKGIIGGGWYQARPFLGPAVRDSVPDVQEILTGGGK